MPQLLALPDELLLRIISLALLVHPRPAHILALSRRVYAFAVPLLYGYLRFPSVRSLACFPATPPRRPRTVTITLAGGEVGRGAFRELEHLFMKCLFGVRRTEGHVNPATSAHTQEYQQLIWLELDELRLCMHSTASSVTDDISLEALALVNPQRFVWTGPDPAHHFSIAIVPVACLNLFKHIGSWTNLEHLRLSNIQFPRFEYWDATGHSLYPLPVVPSLRTVYIGQATIVPIVPLTHFICTPGMSALRKVRLVDCYTESIWGPRVRRSDLERAALALYPADAEQLDMCQKSEEERIPHWVRDRIRAIVRCEAVTERIIGGDRSGGVQNLE
ncbi:hypothetical protein FA95DRAFT_1555839 [Auriscalpium vulgare]|uniref:Uncharacterized protein n=1 Tax=Auriscalpium vulgare TaxID=40419 RepID=A0ACB8S2N1_9AGAM|nr:hypothetical protein FA95DRAFT_1555839 [Auriscalpium vulgare]